MAAQLLLINPKRRRRHRIRRNAKSRHRVHAHRKHRRRRSSALMSYAPRGKHRYTARNPKHRRHRRRIHRNPFGMPNVGGIVSNDLIPAAIGAVGAVGADILWGFISPMFGTTFSGNAYLNALAKSGLVVVAGHFGGKVVGSRKATAATLGALTVITYELVSSLVKTAAPSLPMAGVGAYMPPMNGLGAYLPQMNGMGAYLPQMGAYDALPLMRSNPVRLAGYNPAPYLQGVGDMPYGSSYTGMGGLDGLGELQGSTGMGMF